MVNMAILDDAELAQICRHPDDECERNLAFEEFRGRYLRAIQGWAARFGRKFNWLDPDDLAQEADLGFLAAVRNWDPTKSKMYGFAELCVERRLSTLVRKYCRARQIPPSCVVPLFGAAAGRDNDGGDDALLIDIIADLTSPDPTAEALDEETKKELWRSDEESLSDIELRVLLGYCHGGTYGQLSAELGVSVKTIDNTLARCKRKLRERVECEPWRYDIA